jgi:hypothetical protein
MSKKYLIMDNQSNYKMLFNTFIAPNIQLQLGKQLTKSLNHYNSWVKFYRLEDLNIVTFEYTFIKPRSFASKTITRIKEKIEKLGYTLSMEINSEQYECFQYNIVGKLHD